MFSRIPNINDSTSHSMKVMNVFEKNIFSVNVNSSLFEIDL